MRLLDKGYRVRGLVRDSIKAHELAKTGIEPVIGNLDDLELLTQEAHQSDGVVNAASADHLTSISALLAALKGSGKALLHTSGSSVIGDDARGNHLSDAIFDENTPLVVTPSKQPRRDIDLAVLNASNQDVRSVVICPSLIYGIGKGLNRESIQIPFLVDQARADGVVRVVGKGVNRWSNVHIDDLADLYVLALEKASPGSFYFAANGEASFAEIGQAIAKRLGLGEVKAWSAESAAEQWGKARAYYTFGSNSRVRAARARSELGWTPHRTSLLSWIEHDMTL
jgi:nucleoside-diphosphate-sugar epimerase